MGHLRLDNFLLNLDFRLPFRFLKCPNFLYLFQIQMWKSLAVLLGLVALSIAFPNPQDDDQELLAELDGLASEDGERYGGIESDLDASDLLEIFGIDEPKKTFEVVDEEDEEYGSTHNAGVPKDIIQDDRSKQCSFYAESGYRCVPYYSCENGEIITDGGGLINVRFGGLNDVQLDPETSKCPGSLEMCCRHPDWIGLPIQTPIPIKKPDEDDITDTGDSNEYSDGDGDLDSILDNDGDDDYNDNNNNDSVNTNDNSDNTDGDDDYNGSDNNGSDSVNTNDNSDNNNDGSDTVEEKDPNNGQDGNGGDSYNGQNGDGDNYSDPNGDNYNGQGTDNGNGNGNGNDNALPNIADEPNYPYPTANGYQPQCGRRNYDGVGVRISHSNSIEKQTQFGEWPHMCAVLNRTEIGGVEHNLYVCGGSLIAPNVILTAAHCVE